MRWLAAAAVLLGLFLLHGLTADHDMPMPSTHPASSVPSSQQTSMIDNAHHEAARGALRTGSHADLSSPLAHGHAMLGGCFALIGSVLLLRLLGAWPRRLGSDPLQSAQAHLACLVARLRPPRSFTPSLHQLGIART